MTLDKSNHERLTTEALSEKALANPIRQKILGCLAASEMGSTEIGSKIKVLPNLVNYHFGVLEHCELIEIARTQKGPGSPKKIFRLTPTGHRWSLSLQSSFAPFSQEQNPLDPVQLLLEETVSALAADTSPPSVEPSPNWMRIALDNAGHSKAAAILKAATVTLVDLERECRERLGASGGPPVSSVFCLSGLMRHENTGPGSRFDDRN